jgi:hypothetical protein
VVAAAGGRRRAWWPGRARAEAGRCGAHGRRPEEENYGRVAVAVSGGGLRRQRGCSIGRRGALGEGQQDEGMRWASSGATGGGQEKQAGASGGAAQRPTSVLLRGRGRAEEEEGGGGRQGLRCKLQKLQGSRCKVMFSHCFIPQMRKWSN